MIPCSPILGASGKDARAIHVGSVGFTPGGFLTPITWPPGTQVGDLAILTFWEASTSSDFAVISGGDGGWSSSHDAWTVFGYRSAYFFKKLTAGDMVGVSLQLPDSGTAIVLSVYRGPNTLAKRVQNVSGGTTLIFPGFTKNAACMGLVTIAHDRDPSSVPKAPTNFIKRQTFSAGYFSISVADLLETGKYPNGSSIGWSDFASFVEQFGWVLELRS